MTPDSTRSEIGEETDPDTGFTERVAEALDTSVGRIDVPPKLEPLVEEDVPHLDPAILFETIGWNNGWPNERATDLRGLKASELAFWVWECAEIYGCDNFLTAYPDGALMAYKDGIWVQDGADILLNQFAKDAVQKEASNQLVNELETQIKKSAAIPRDTLGVEPGKVAVGNGLLDLEAAIAGGDDVLSEPERGDYLLNRIRTEYDPDASFQGTRFDEFIDESVAEDDRDALQEYAGYCLWAGGQPFKKALFLIGPPDTGKGTFTKTMALVLGEDNVAWQSLYNLIRTRWGTDKLYGKLANFSDEVTAGPLKGVDQFKKFVGGGDRVVAESKNDPTYEFTVTQKFIFATNQFPRMQNADEAFWNRCLFAEFPNSLEEDEMDRDLKDTFEGERSAILNWMIEGLGRLLRQGHFTGERQNDAKRGLAKSFGSPVQQFIFDAIDVTGNADDVVHKGELYEAFTRFCDWIEADSTPVKGTFTKQLKRESGVDDGQSRRVGAGGDRQEVYQGIHVDESFLKQIQATVPDSATG